MTLIPKFKFSSHLGAFRLNYLVGSLFKLVGFEKSHDSVSCDFIDYMLIIFRFNDKWMSWIWACDFARNLIPVGEWLINTINI